MDPRKMLSCYIEAATNFNRLAHALGLDMRVPEVPPAATADPIRGTGYKVRVAAIWLRQLATDLESGL